MDAIVERGETVEPGPSGGGRRTERTPAVARGTGAQHRGEAPGLGAWHTGAPPSFGGEPEQWKATGGQHACFKPPATEHCLKQEDGSQGCRQKCETSQTSPPAWTTGSWLLFHRRCTTPTPGPPWCRRRALSQRLRGGKKRAKVLVWHAGWPMSPAHWG